MFTPIYPSHWAHLLKIVFDTIKNVHSMKKVQFPDLELFLTYKTVSPSSWRVMTWMYDCESSSRLSAIPG